MARPSVQRLALAAMVAVLALPAEVGAYEFWTRARTIGQAYELRGFRVFGGELAIGRRRLTQLLTLTLHDLGELERTRRRAGRRGRGPVVSWHSTLRFEHDLGTFLTGRLAVAPTLRQDALDVIPELGASAFSLALLHGYVRLEGLWGDRLSVSAGRLASVTLDGALPFDGAQVRAELAPGWSLEAGGGLAVREASWLGVGSYELDGAPGAFCHEYRAAAAGELGRWRMIERDELVTDGRFTSDYERCPQRQARMATAEAALGGRLPGQVEARLSYRVAASASADSLAGPLYPEHAPRRGTNLERLAATASARWRLGPVQVSPLLLARASLAHGLVDRLELSTELARGRHALEPSASRVVPTFDTDSIWNVFAGEPSTELALGYRYDGGVRAVARLWARRYDGGDSGGTAWAWGGHTEAERPLARTVTLRGRALADGGYGGERAAADGELRWSSATASLAGRAALVWARPEAEGALSTATSVRASWALASGVVVQSALELWRDRQGQLGVRGLGVLELTLEPNR